MTCSLCGTPLGRDNATGVCREHQRVAYPCVVPGCPNRCGSHSKSRHCAAHHFIQSREAKRAVANARLGAAR